MCILFVCMKKNAEPIPLCRWRTWRDLYLCKFKLLQFLSYIYVQVKVQIMHSLFLFTCIYVGKPDVPLPCLRSSTEKKIQFSFPIFQIRKNAFNRFLHILSTYITGATPLRMILDSYIFLCPGEGLVRTGGAGAVVLAALHAGLQRQNVGPDCCNQTVQTSQVLSHEPPVTILFIYLSFCVSMFLSGYLTLIWGFLYE